MLDTFSLRGRHKDLLDLWTSTNETEDLVARLEVSDGVVNQIANIYKQTCDEQVARQAVRILAGDATDRANFKKERDDAVEKFRSANQDCIDAKKNEIQAIKNLKKLTCIAVVLGFVIIGLLVGFAVMGQDICYGMQLPGGCLTLHQTKSIMGMKIYHFSLWLRSGIMRIFGQAITATDSSLAYYSNNLKP